jgi:hypothetical protein
MALLVKELSDSFFGEEVTTDLRQVLVKRRKS